MQTGRQGECEIVRLQDWETVRLGDWEIRRLGVFQKILKETHEYIGHQAWVLQRYHQTMYIRTPNPSWSPPPPPLLLSSPPPLLPSSPPPPPLLCHIFLHQLQTSITQSFNKLECFLWPFLRSRSYDGSAHTFRSRIQLLEVPKKALKK